MLVDGHVGGSVDCTWSSKFHAAVWQPVSRTAVRKVGLIMLGWTAVGFPGPMRGYSALGEDKKVDREFGWSMDTLIRVLHFDYSDWHS